MTKAVLGSCMALVLACLLMIGWWFGTMQPINGMAASANGLDLYVPASSSVALYRHPHAVWLVQDKQVGDNLGTLLRTLHEAKQQKRRPEMVIYFIPERDLGESSEGGFATFEQYYSENQLLAPILARFVKETGIKPRVYLEPDALAHAFTFEQERNYDQRSRTIYQNRVKALRYLVTLYSEAGCLVYLDAAHSAWINNDDALGKMAKALRESGYEQAYGLVTNVSNRQPVTPNLTISKEHETAFLEKLLKALPKAQKDVVVDTSRNGGPTRPRQYYLAEDGRLYDNEQPSGRLIGYWRKEAGSGELVFHPFLGHQKRLTRLLRKEKYQYLADKQLLVAPPWLDPIGDVQLGAPPTDKATPKPVDRYRYIKPPDECDGSLSCPPGASKSALQQQITTFQTGVSNKPVSLPWQ